MFYLDNAATTPVQPQVLERCLPYLNSHFGNPSSVYDLGIKAAQAIKGAREQVAKVFQVRTEGIVFCSGATESNFMALMGCVCARTSTRTAEKAWSRRGTASFASTFAC